jgi:hypothetical protein
MMAFGLALVLATTTVVTTQSAQAGFRGGFNGVNGGQTPPGWGVASGTPAVNHNPNLGGTTPTG